MILMYHKIYPESPTMWWVTANDFWRQMEELNRYKVVFLDEYDPIDPQHVVITFDGVYENVYTYAFPILKKFGYPFELFIVGETIGKGNEFDQPAEPPARFANIEQLKAMASGGGRLQWHSRTHKDLTACINDIAAIDEELHVPEGIRRLDPKGFRWFAYPHGRHNPALIGHIKKFFYGALSCEAGNDQDRYQFNRITVTNKTGFTKSTVSLIIANYNYGRFAHEAIESALLQTVKPDEILFIDDCSTDNSMEVAERFKDKIRIVRNERNLGIVDNFNKAVSLTSGDYICFLGADNRFRSDYVERCKYALDTNPEAAIAYTDAVIFGPLSGVLARKVGAIYESDTRDIYLWRFPDFNEDSIKILRQRNFIHGSSMYRRSAFNDVKGYIKSNGPEDHNLFVRMIDKGWKAVRVPEFVLEYRQHSSEQANTQLNYSLELAYYRRQLRLKESENNVLKNQLSLLLRLTSEYIKTGQMPNELHAIMKNIIPAPGETLPMRTNIQKGLVSIVILTFNQLKYTKECIESIKRHTPEMHEIIFVDNGSKDGTVRWLRQLIKENPNYRLIENQKNLGFAKGCNQGIEASRGEYILLLNNDVVVTECWLSGMLECLNSAPDIGIVGPMTNNISGIQKVPDANYSIGELNDYAMAFREKNRYRRALSKRIVGFCMLFRRELVDKIGLLDERFGSGNFEDDDYCLRAALKGYKNVIAGDVFIHHYGSKSFTGNNIDYNAAMAKNRRIFVQRWSSVDVKSPEGKMLLSISNMSKADEFNQKGQLDKSVDLLLECIKHFPQYKEGYYRLAEILIENKKYQDALDVLEAMPAVLDADVRSYELRAYCKEGMGLYDEAEVYADKALKMNSKSAKAINIKGIVAIKKGHISDAERLFEYAIESDKGFAEAYSNLGVLKWSQGKTKDALGFFEKAFILFPINGDIATNYYSAALTVSGLDRIGEIFKDAIALYPFNKRLKYLFIDILVQQGRHYEALRQIEDAMIVFGVDEDILSVALELRNTVGPYDLIKEPHQKGTISLCMIVKNEEKYIVRCLSSIKPAVDEIIVVDTGSTDRTKDICKAFGAKVYDFEWAEDFSEARNFSLLKASGDWILVLDADEVVSDMDYALLRRLTQKTDKRPVAYTFVTRNYVEQVHTVGWNANDGRYFKEEAGTGWMPSVKVRLFPNDRRISFENQVHELVEPSLKRLGIPFKDSGIPIHHYGKLDKKGILSKGDNYYTIGEKKLKENIDDPKAIFEIAAQAAELGRHDDALKHWKKLISLSPNSPHAYYGAGSACFGIGKYDEALSLFKTAIKLDSNTRETVVMCATCEIFAGNIDNAVSNLIRLSDENPEYPMPLAVLAVANCCLGKQDKALEYLEKLKRMQFSVAQYLYDFAKRLVDAGKCEYAISVLEAAVESRNITNDTPLLLAECYKMRMEDAMAHHGK